MSNPPFNDSDTAKRGSAFLQSEAIRQVVSEANENIVALPGQLFYSTQILGCLWFYWNQATLARIWGEEAPCPVGEPPSMIWVKSSLWKVPTSKARLCRGTRQVWQVARRLA
jgi:type I restriction-modification system DNA methylase subunit